MLVAIAITIWPNITKLMDAYGAGAPYYRRTANMDKWQDPLRWLVPFALLVGTGMWTVTRFTCPRWCIRPPARRDGSAKRPNVTVRLSARLPAR